MRSRHDLAPRVISCDAAICAQFGANRKYLATARNDAIDPMRKFALFRPMSSVRQRTTSAPLMRGGQHSVTVARFVAVPFLNVISRSPILVR
jgi:hypothetical protein